MSLHKLTAGSGHDYLTRQVAALDATHKGHTGLASYYADSFHGRTTASGVTFDNRAPVAAHPSLPFGSLVRITNIANGRSVDVRVIDRGPAASARARGVIVDVSRAVAEQLDFVLAGRTQVRLEVLQRGRPR